MFTGFLKYNKPLLNKGKRLSCNGTEPITITPTRIGSTAVENFCSRIIKWKDKTGTSQYSVKILQIQFHGSKCHYFGPPGCDNT